MALPPLKAGKTVTIGYGTLMDCCRLVGRIDEIEFYSRPLRPGELARMYIDGLKRVDGCGDR